MITHNFPEKVNDRKDAGDFISDISEELTKYFKVNVFCPGKRIEEEKRGKIKITRFLYPAVEKLGDLKIFNIFDWSNFILFFKNGIQEILIMNKKNKPDFILAMWAFPAGVFAYLAKRKYKAPYAVWCLGSDINVYARLPIFRLIIKKILREADFLIADGINLASDVEKLSGKKCFFIPSVSNFPIIEHQKHEGNLIHLTFLGRVEKIKGPDIFLQALSYLETSLKSFRITLIGDGKLMPVLRKMAKENNLENSIVFMGNMSDKTEISKIIRQSDWLIIPSRSDSIPLVFSESMKNGTPVIASDLPDLKYLIHKYKVGYLFQKENARDLAKVLKNVIIAGRQKEVFMKNCRKASLDFSLENSGLKVSEYINKLIKN